MSKIKKFLLLAVVPVLLIVACSKTNHSTKNISVIVDTAVKPILKEYEIPGMAIAVVNGGKTSFFNYGIMSKKTKMPITDKTLFEIGSVSKTFTATILTSFALSKELELNDKVGKYIPYLNNTAIGNATLVQLATHTSGVPLFAPQELKNQKQFISYLETLYLPNHPARIYSNVGIGLLGILMEQKTNTTYQELLADKVLTPLGLINTFVYVPPKCHHLYAEGYDAKNKPIRTSENMLLPAAYGVKSCTYDLVKYLRANLESMKKSTLETQKALYDTHYSYYRTPYFEQDLVWEQYPFPISLKKLIDGNSRMALNSSAKKYFSTPQKDVWINKTGSTNGFSTYVVFIPSKKLGFVMLANKYFPNKERVKIAFKILSKICEPHNTNNISSG